MRDSTSRPNLSVPSRCTGAAVDRAEEMPVRRDQAEQAVGRALDEEAEQLRVVVVRPDDRLEGDRVEFVGLADRIAARPKAEVAVPVAEADGLRRREGDVGHLRIDRREEIGEHRHQQQRRRPGRARACRSASASAGARPAPDSFRRDWSLGGSDRRRFRLERRRQVLVVRGSVAIGSCSTVRLISVPSAQAHARIDQRQAACRR